MLDKTLVIIPTYNEIDNVEKMAKQMFGLYPSISILIVDDNSPDGTANKVTEMQREFPNLRLLKRAGKLGLGTAYLEGFQYALDEGFDRIVEMDCDFSHDPKDVGALVEKSADSDCVIGSRYIDGIRIINWPIKRLLLSSFAAFYVRTITGMKLTDPMAGFKCITSKALRALDFNKVSSNGYSFQTEIHFRLYKKGLTISEHPIVFTERRDGQSKMSGSVIFEAVYKVIVLKLRSLFGAL